MVNVIAFNGKLLKLLARDINHFSIQQQQNNHFSYDSLKLVWFEKCLLILRFISNSFLKKVI